jgi:hypothetical protein
MPLETSPRTAKDTVVQWSTVCSYVALCSDGSQASAYDVEVQIGKAELWYVRTVDNDVAPNTGFLTREWAKKAAKQLATTNHEGGAYNDSQSFLGTFVDDFSDDPNQAGLFCIYLDHPIERFSTWEQAETYQTIHHLGHCQIRCLVEGDWVPCT